MGLLDEAIREHLELKRRAGADATEVARQEREALGPVVRGDPLTADLPPSPIYEVPPDERFEPELYDEAADDYDDGLDDEPEALHETTPHVPAPPLPGPPPPALPSRPPPAHYPPVQAPIERHEAAAGEDDVLEQTPEFLQETPEHDRLWFEQAPPQEFDFDK